MSESKHTPTPGPWELKLDDRRLMNPVEKTWYLSADGIGIAVQATFSDPERAEANAHLIAAAPDMLEALYAAYIQLAGFAQELSEGEWPEGQITLQSVSAAIAKAKGE